MNSKKGIAAQKQLSNAKRILNCKIKYPKKWSDLLRNGLKKKREREGLRILMHHAA